MGGICWFNCQPTGTCLRYTLLKWKYNVDVVTQPLSTFSPSLARRLPIFEIRKPIELSWKIKPKLFPIVQANLLSIQHLEVLSLIKRTVKYITIMFLIIFCSKKTYKVSFGLIFKWTSITSKVFVTHAISMAHYWYILLSRHLTHFCLKYNNIATSASKDCRLLVPVFFGWYYYTVVYIFHKVYIDKNKFFFNFKIPCSCFAIFLV